MKKYIFYRKEIERFKVSLAKPKFFHMRNIVSSLAVERVLVVLSMNPFNDSVHQSET